MTNTLPQRARKPATIPAVDARARLIRLVHVARRDLQLDEPTYRAMLMAQTGRDSASLLGVGELQKVVDCLKRSGFKVASKSSRRVPAAKAGGVSTVLAQSPEARKARAMWLMLHAIGQVRDPSEAALIAYGKRQCKVDRLEWVNDALPLVESLKAWCLRSLPAVVMPFLAQPLQAWAGHMSAGFHDDWERSRSALQRGLEKGNVQLLNEWAALWELTVVAKEAQR